MKTEQTEVGRLTVGNSVADEKRCEEPISPLSNRQYGLCVNIQK